MTSKLRVLVALIGLSCGSICEAALITYSASQVSQATWRYDYTITNDTLADPIEEFTIYFDRDMYSNLAIDASPDHWDPLIIQPDPWLPDDGFFDALALSTGIELGQTLTGFSVLFDWLAPGTPGAQAFDVIDPVTFSALESGLTTLRIEPPPASVPEPATLALLTVALAGLGVRRRAQ